MWLCFNSPLSVITSTEEELLRGWAKIRRLHKINTLHPSFIDKWVSAESHDKIHTIFRCAETCDHQIHLVISYLLSSAHSAVPLNGIISYRSLEFYFTGLRISIKIARQREKNVSETIVHCVISRAHRKRAMWTARKIDETKKAMNSIRLFVMCASKCIVCSNVWSLLLSIIFIKYHFVSKELSSIPAIQFIWSAL